MQFRQGVNEGMAASIELHQVIKHLRGEVSKMFRTFKVLEMSLAIFRPVAFAGQVPANGKAAIFHKMPKQSELSEVADSSDLPNLHFASNHTTGEVRPFSVVEQKFHQLSRKGHTANLSTVSSWRAFGGESR